MTRALAEEELAALYRDADVALVLPLRSAGRESALPSANVLMGSNPHSFYLGTG